MISVLCEESANRCFVFADFFEGGNDLVFDSSHDGTSFFEFADKVTDLALDGFSLLLEALLENAVKD